MADKVIPGTKARKQFQVVKGQKDTREIRCTKCKGVAAQVADGKGGFIHKCFTCGTTFRFSSL